MPTTAVTNWGEALLSSLASALAIFLGAIPRVIGFLVILIIGWMIATALAGAVSSLLRAVRFNELATRSGFSGFLQQTGIRDDASAMVADLVKWFVRLIVLVMAFDALGLPAVSQVLQQLLLWLPNLVAALVILVVAGLAANALFNVVRAATARAGLGNPGLFANAARAAVWVFAIAAALNQIGLAANLVTTLFTALVAAVALAIALAFGLGGRDVAADMEGRWYQQAQLAGPKMAKALAAARREMQTATDGPAINTAAFQPPPRGRVLPLESSLQPAANGWSLSLPVRAEEVAVDKQAVVAEEVAVRPERVQDVVHVEETVQREELHVEAHGDIEVDRRGTGGRDSDQQHPGQPPAR